VGEQTQLTRFIRCPYAFVAVERGLLLPEDLVDRFSEQLINAGTDFHERVLDEAVPMPAGLTLEEAFAGEGTVLGLPVLRNEKLKLLGAPDGVIAADGGLLPIEIKSHKNLQRTDLLELAFYWLVLEPFRTRHDISPRGQLLLRRDGVAHPVDVELTEELFSELDGLIAQLRRARRYGVKPRVCGCIACSGPLAEQVLRLTRRGKDLSMIWGIGPRYAEVLEGLGLGDYDALIDCDPRRIARDLRARRRFVGAEQVEQWRQHARAYQEARAVVFGRRHRWGSGSSPWIWNMTLTSG